MSKITKISSKSLAIILRYFLTTFAQNQYSVAPEIWSKPVEIKAISKWAGSVQGISVTPDGKKLFLTVSGIAETILTDTGWSTPKRLNNKVNVDNFVRDPCISPDGKRLFYGRYNGGTTWNMYYSNWDTTINDWGIGINCGPEINTPGYGFDGCTTPDDSTVIFLRSDQTYIAHWDKKNNTWGNVSGWGHDSLSWFTSYWGICVTPNRKKVYLLNEQTDITNGDSYLKADLSVYYRNPTDTLTYKYPNVLNISYQADTLYYNGEYVDRFQGYPTLTADGKTLFFVAKYHGKATVYESHMLVDENGNPVTSVYDYKNKNIPKSFALGVPYPNPFNPETTVEYKLSKASKVKISVFNILGEKVKELYSGNRPAGSYKIKFNAINLSSGVYLIFMKTRFGYCVQKSIYIK